MDYTQKDSTLLQDVPKTHENYRLASPVLEGSGNIIYNEWKSKKDIFWRIFSFWISNKIFAKT